MHQQCQDPGNFRRLRRAQLRIIKSDRADPLARYPRSTASRARIITGDGARDRMRGRDVDGA
jgi:hypothetical protein